MSHDGLGLDKADAPDRTFAEIPEQFWVASNDLAFAIRDKFPVSSGHTLVIPRRTVVDWWQATPAERLALLALVDEVKADLDGEFTPAGYNVGFNDGRAAGQTVFHLHLHVIPRFHGDMADPSGGVRHVIPEKGNYRGNSAKPDLVAAGQPTVDRVHDAPGRSLLPALVDAIAHPAINTADLAVSFVMVSGLRVLNPILDVLLDRNSGRIRLLTTDYLGVTEKDALEQLLKLSVQSGDRFQVRVFMSGNTSFHPKTYILTASSGASAGLLFVGSANASRSGLVDGHEWTLESRDSEAIAKALQRFEELWEDGRSVPLTRPVIDAYVQAPRRLDGEAALTEPATQPVAPTEIQSEALDALALTRADGFGAGLAVMATGLGKTWLAAFD
ncbi:MAG: HIT domain-containing protein, partial [Actinomycetes bacterium]